MLEEIIKLVFTPLVIIGAFLYFFQKIFEKNILKDIEKFKIQLSTESESAKSKLQNELNIELFKYQTKFSFFHQKQAELITIVYQKLFKLSHAITDLIKPVQMGGQSNLIEKKKLAADLYNELFIFFGENRIYFDKNICDKLDDILKVIFEAYIDFDIAHTDGMQNSEFYKSDYTGLWIDAWKSLENKLPPLKVDLENFLRKIIIISNDD